MTDWVRLWHDMPTDPKWRTIARKSGQRIGDVIAVFNFMMVNASANASQRGSLNGFDVEDVATALDLKDEDVEAILSAMQGKVIDGEFLSGWEKRQPKRDDDSARRVAAFRERKFVEKQNQKSVLIQDVTESVTQCNAHVTHCNAPETDTDTELVRENNKHSTKTNLLSDSKSDDTKSIDKIEVADKPVKTRKAYTEVFEQFWDAYPTDKMMSKSNASKQFTKLSPEDRQAVIAAVEPFKVWLAGQKDYRTLHAERFISQRRFDGFRPDEGTPRLVASNFYAKAESAELEAWDAYWRLTKGKSAPRDKYGGWYFPAEWPPNEEKAA